MSRASVAFAGHSEAGATSNASTASIEAIEPNEVVSEYCTRCHNEQRRSGDLVLEGFDVERAPENADVAERMIRNLRAGMMPPQGAS